MTVSLSPRTKLLALLGIVLLAAFLRLYHIDTIPPGDRYDPAYYGVDALEILDGARPIFLETNFGREALFSYLVALAVTVLGAEPWTMYVVSALVGILTVPAVYLLGEELLRREDDPLGQLGGLLAALAVAVSYWHLNWSRFGVRAILLPLLAALVFYFLWRGLRTRTWWPFAASGFFLGLSTYTYQAARILPVLVVLAFVYDAISRRTFTRRDVGHLFLVALVALLVFLPLGSYFLAHPDSFLQRIEQAAAVEAEQGLSGNLASMGKGFGSLLLAFSFHGDEEPTTGIPGRPALNGFLALLFFAGVLIAILRFKKPVYLFLLSWLLVMSIPAVLSQFGPVTKRAIGTFPAVIVLIAVGAIVPWEALNRWAARRASKRGHTLKGTGAAAAAVALGVALALGFVFSAALTYRDYFVVWAGDPDLFTHFETGPTAIGQYAGSLPWQEAIYVSPVSADHPSIVYNSLAHPGLKGYDGQVCLVAPSRTGQVTTYVIVPGEDGHSLALLPGVFPQGEIVAEGPRHYQQPYFLAFHVPEGSQARIEPARPVGADWGGKMRLLGYDLDAEGYRPGETVRLTLYWQALAPMDADYTVFAQVLGEHNPATAGPLWAQNDGEPCQRAYPTSTWTPGEILRDEINITLPADAPPGEYELKVGAYLLASMARLPATDADGNPLPDDALLLGTVEIGE